MPDTVTRRAAKLLFPGRHNVALAIALARPSSTIRAWLSGRRRMPPTYLRALASSLLRQHEGDLALSLAQALEWQAKQQDAEVRPLRGFYEIKMRNGIMQDARWRGGWRRKI